RLPHARDCTTRSCVFCSLTFVLLRHAPRSTLFPYTTLFRSHRVMALLDVSLTQPRLRLLPQDNRIQTELRYALGMLGAGTRRVEDRKSTRLNSSHVKISYAGFCLKQKKRASALGAVHSWAWP